MLDPVSTWSSTFNDLPKVANTSWALNLANAVSSLTTGKLEILTIKTIPSNFVFGIAAFKSALELLTFVDSAVEGANNFANAWEQGLLGSVMTVLPGASVGLPATPANTYAPTPATLIDAASIAAAKAGLIATITGIAPAENADAFADAFRTAFLTLTCSTTGMNMVTPPSGPQPLLNLFAPVG